MLAKIRERGRHHFSNPRGNQKSFFVNNRFELAIAFLKEANRAEKYAQQENPERIRDFLKKIGSNFRIAERTLSFPLKNAWVIAEKYHAEAQRAEATSYDFFESTIWRRGWESNPQVLADAGFQDRWNSHYPTSPNLDLCFGLLVPIFSK